MMGKNKFYSKYATDEDLGDEEEEQDKKNNKAHGYAYPPNTDQYHENHYGYSGQYGQSWQQDPAFSGGFNAYSTAYPIHNAAASFPPPGGPPPFGPPPSFAYGGPYPPPGTSSQGSQQYLGMTPYARENGGTTRYGRAGMPDDWLQPQGYHYDSRKRSWTHNEGGQFKSKRTYTYNQQIKRRKDMARRVLWSRLLYSHFFFMDYNPETDRPECWK